MIYQYKQRLYYTIPSSLLVLWRGVFVLVRPCYGVNLFSVGIWLQILVLEPTVLGLDICIEVSIAGYPKVMKQEPCIHDDVGILGGLALDMVILRLL